ncbi:hypothetical protein OB905_11790 [Halobacteria archaeon AArc-dxtr1]|nr:hypothetical protein [Halobacteria archaeon AArc-dxtr1]
MVATDQVAGSARSEVGRLLDFSMWMEVVLVFAGYLLPYMLKTFLEGRDIVTLPNEAYGVATIMGTGIIFSGNTRQALGVGGGVFVAQEVVTNRLGVTDALEGE